MSALPPAVLGPKPTVSGRDGLVVTSHPYAARAGADALAAGGNAVDAVLAAAAAQLIVEPHMTSLTGGLSVLSRTADGVARYLNGNVHAPLAPLPGFGGDDLTTGRGVPVPGWWPAFREASETLGRLGVERTLAPAIAVAHEGFPVNPFLFALMYGSQANLGSHEQMLPVFFPGGGLLSPGDILVQHQAGRTLERLATEGDRYYLGDFARAFVAENRRGGGVIAVEDFERARPRWDAPVTGRYRGLDLLASAPPDDGGQMLAEALAMLDSVDLAGMGRPTESFETLRLLIEVHDEVYYATPRRGEPYQSAEELAELRSPDHGAARLAAVRAGRRGLSAAALPTPGTIHVSAVDADGGVASLTHSHMASAWVNGLFAEGFQLAGGGSFFQRGMPAPGEKAAVYLAPHVLLRDGRPAIVGGSPSVSLVACVLQNIVNLVDFAMPIAESVAAPRFGARPHDPAFGWRPGVMLENGFPPEIAGAFRDWTARERLWSRVVGPWYTLMGNYEGIVLDAGGTATASADPRRVGSAEAVR
jgi:gamma-glutamyltranspeptidase/glutathione hydrolase